MEREISLKRLTVGDLRELRKNGPRAIIDGDKKALRVIEDRKTELTRKIIQQCVSCPHLKFGGGLQCDRKKSQCHSSRVRKWLKELAELER